MPLSPTLIVGYLGLFFAAGAIFLLVNLLVGKLLRPDAPNEEKLEIYECGEPTIGSSFVQFDLRFYVVALLFLIFDVEVAFFFPWATVFGKAGHLRDTSAPLARVNDLYAELGLPPVEAGGDAAATAVAETAQAAAQLATISVCDILVFFGVVMVGFFYVWKRGDLDWVRAVSRQRAVAPPEPEVRPEEQQPVLSA